MNFMPGLYEIRWLPSDRVKRFHGSRGNYYEFSESDRLDLHSEPIWCRRCADITHGEYLSTIEKLDTEIRDLHDPTSQCYRMARHGSLDLVFGKGEELLQERLIEVERRRRWRMSRKSPPKCIHCGSIEIVMLPLGKLIPNPVGEGELRVKCVGMCSTSFNEWFFTPEGDRIPRETRPTYWHHPELDSPENGGRFQKWLRSLPRGRGGSKSD
jgi:hypothetical protein